jgi:hypothetical protein
MATMDQVVWSNCNVMVDGEHTSFTRGQLLPAAASQDELDQRTLLRLGGALRTVEVVYTAEELAEQAQQRGEATAARDAAYDVDPTLPSGQQMPGTMEPGRPTLMEPSGSPVVLGTEDDRKAAQRSSRSRPGSKPADPPDKDPGAAAARAGGVGTSSGATGAGDGKGTGSPDAGNSGSAKPAGSK